MDTRSNSLKMRGMPFIGNTPNCWRDIVVSSVSSLIRILISKVC